MVAKGCRFTELKNVDLGFIALANPILVLAV
jgi:hypothetical protein